MGRGLSGSHMRASCARKCPELCLLGSHLSQSIFVNALRRVRDESRAFLVCSPFQAEVPSREYALLD